MRRQSTPEHPNTAGQRPPDELIYVSRQLTERAMTHLQSLRYPHTVGGEAPPTRAELEAGLRGASAAVVTLTEQIDADLLAAAGRQLKLIANVAVGYDNIDLAAATSAGITITNTPVSWTRPAPTTPSP